MGGCLSGWQLGMKLKRALDILLAGLAVAALSPVMALVAVVVRVRLGAPVLFRQERAGRNGVPFEILKFRTMRVPGPGEWDPATDADRLTAVGTRLRRWSLDELPQLFNVLRGDMSLVGPRPLPVRYIGRYSAAQRERLAVLPGLTGWAQVNGRNNCSWATRLECDVWYVRNQSLALDLQVLARTVAHVFHGHGIRHGPHATMVEFQGE